MNKKIQCFVCESTKITTSFKLKTHKIGRCMGCRTYVNMDFNEMLVQETFGQEYYEKIQSFAFNIERIGKADPSYEIYLKGLKLLEQMLPDKQSLKRVLDVGAGYGSFVLTAIDEGWDARGVELSEYAANVAREKNGLPVSGQTLQELLASKSEFTAVTLWDVIEHVSGIEAMLAECFQLLSPGGKLLIATDNFDSLIGDFSRTLYSTIRWKWPLQRFLIPQNTVYFDISTLELIASRVGFTLRHLEFIDYPIEKINTNFLQKFILKKLYVWGSRTNRNSQFLCVFER